MATALPKPKNPDIQMYFGEKPIKIEKNIKVYEGDLVDKKLYDDMSVVALNAQTKNKELEKEIAELKKEKQTILNDLVKERADRAVDQTTYATSLKGKEALIDNWHGLYKANRKFQDEYIAFLGENLKDGKGSIIKNLSMLQDLLVKSTNPDGTYKTFWTIKELVDENAVLKIGQQAIFDVLGNADVNTTTDIKNFLTVGGKQKTLKELNDEWNVYYTFFDTTRKKLKKATSADALTEMDALLADRIRFNQLVVANNTAKGFFINGWNILNPKPEPTIIKVVEVKKLGLQRTSIKPQLMNELVNLAAVLNWTTNLTPWEDGGT